MKRLLIVGLLLVGGCWAGGEDQLAEEVQIPHPGGGGLLAFRPPRGWQAYQPDELPCEVAYFGDRAEGFNRSLNVTFEKNSEDLKSYMGKLEQELPALLEKLTVESSNAVKAGDVDGWQLVTQFTSGNLNLRCMQTTFVTGEWKVSFTFECLARDFADERELFSKCVESFRWLRVARAAALTEDR